MAATNSTSPFDLVLSNAQVVPLATYTTLAAVLGLLGNTLVLYSSIRYDSIKLDQVSLLFVQNLAAADLLYVLFNILPVSVTLLAGRYILGDIYCFVSAQLSFLPGAMNALTIFALTSYRLNLVLAPFRSMTVRSAKIVLVLIFIGSTSLTDICLAYESRSIFLPTVAKCVSTIYINKEASVLFLTTLSMILFIPMAVITIINSILCVISVKSARRCRIASKGRSIRPLVTVCVLSGMFIVSWVPYLSYAIWKRIDPAVPLPFILLSYACIQLNSFLNPILYTLTNKRFGTYVRDVACGMLPCIESEKSGTQSKTSTTGVQSSSKDERESKA